jgi:hypothetical protein
MPAAENSTCTEIPERAPAAVNPLTTTPTLEGEPLVPAISAICLAASALG